MNKVIAFSTLLILIASIGILNVAPARGANAHAIAITMIAPVIVGSGSAGTGTLSLITIYQVRLNPTPTLLQGAGAFNGTLSIAGKVAGIFVLNTATLSATGCVFSGVVSLGSFVGTRVTIGIFGNCLEQQTDVVEYKDGEDVTTIYHGQGVGTIHPNVGIWQNIAPSVAGSGSAGTGTLSVTTAYTAPLTGPPVLLAGVGVASGTLGLLANRFSFEIDRASFSATGCVMSGVIISGSFPGQPVTETIFGNCLPSQTTTVTLVFQIGGDPHSPLFLGRGLALSNPFPFTLN